MFMFEPDLTPETLLQFLSRYGVAIGIGEVVDTASFIAPNPPFLQIKRSNGQFPPHPINEGFDILYMPGSAYVASSVDPATIPITDSGRPYVFQSIVASTTLSSWAETDLLGDIRFDEDEDRRGPLPVAVTVEAISEIAGTPNILDGEFVTTNMVIIGDTDFASNSFISSARNSDLLVNSVNWLAKDFELITIRPKVRAFRELALTKNERDFVRWAGWLLMPTLVGLAGFGMWWRRR
jgi:hypothetical protein